MHFCYERDRERRKEKHSSEQLKGFSIILTPLHETFKLEWHANDLKLFLAVVVAVVGS